MDLWDRVLLALFPGPFENWRKGSGIYYLTEQPLNFSTFREFQIHLILLPDTKFFRCALQTCWKNRVWTLSRVKPGRNYTSVLACCHTDHIAQEIVNYIITDSQLADLLVTKQTLLVVDNVMNTYNYLPRTQAPPLSLGTRLLRTSTCPIVPSITYTNTVKEV